MRFIFPLVFKAMGKIEGGGSGSSIDYTWKLKNPRIFDREKVVSPEDNVAAHTAIFCLLMVCI